MRLQVDDGAVQVEACAGGISLLTIEGLGELDPECAIVTLTRRQVIELVAILSDRTTPPLTVEEIIGAKVRLVVNKLQPGDFAGRVTEDDFMEDHGDNL